MVSPVLPHDHTSRSWTTAGLSRLDQPCHCGQLARTIWQGENQAEHWIVFCFGTPRVYPVHKGDFFCEAFFILASQAGIHVMTLLDFYPCGPLLLFWFLIFQTIAIAWVFGGKRLNLRTISTLSRLWRSVRDMTGVDSLRIFWLLTTLILAPLALMVTFVNSTCFILFTGFLPCCLCEFWGLVAWSGEQDRWKHSPIPLQCLDCWCVLLVFSSWIELYAFSGYAIYFLIASGCSCRGACTPSQDERRELEDEEEMEEMEKMEVDREMVGVKSGVYPALP